MGVRVRLAWVGIRLGHDSWYGVLRDFETTYPVHKESMVRAYVVTFAFVTFRLLNDYGPTSHLQPDSDRIVTIV